MNDRQRLEAIVAVVCKYLPPDGISREQAMNEIIGLIDPLPAQQEQEPVAWRTFDGEGGYDYCSYEDNESYADDWSKRNPNHAGWVDKLYTHSQLEPPTVDVRILQAVSDEYNAWIRAHAAGMGYDDFLIQRLAAHGIKENT